jgi:molybdate transport system substrate-binding protein
VRPRLLACGLLALVCTLGPTAGCGGDDGDGEATRLTVLAASSLRESFEDIAAAFEVEHPDIEVELSFDASSALATQVVEGAPADVFASADQANLDQVIGGGLGAGDPVVFASNRLQIVVPEGNPAGIRSMADIGAGGTRVALCAPEVPCGSYAAQAFANAGLAVPRASQEENVRGVLTKVALGEADAGIVYVTDVLTRDDVDGVDLPDEINVVATYPAIALRDAPDAEAAAEFLAFLAGSDAQAILAAHGFAAPPGVSDR